MDVLWRPETAVYQHNNVIYQLVKSIAGVKLGLISQYSKKQSLSEHFPLAHTDELQLATAALSPPQAHQECNPHARLLQREHVKQTLPYRWRRQRFLYGATAQEEGLRLLCGVTEQPVRHGLIRSPRDQNALP